MGVYEAGLIDGSNRKFLIVGSLIRSIKAPDRLGIIDPMPKGYLTQTIRVARSLNRFAVKLDATVSDCRNGGRSSIHTGRDIIMDTDS